MAVNADSGETEAIENNLLAKQHHSLGFNWYLSNTLMCHLKTFEGKKSGLEFSVFGHLNTVLANSAKIREGSTETRDLGRLRSFKNFVRDNGRVSAGLGVNLRLGHVNCEAAYNFLTLGKDGDVPSPYEFRIISD
jgi:hypothetical protein